MKHVIGVLANFGKRWLVDRGWRRTTALAFTAAVYIGLHLAAFLAGGFPTLVLTTNFFLIMASAGLLGLWGALAAATLSGILGGPLLVYFVLPTTSAVVGVHWGYRLLVFESFGLISGIISSIFRYQIAAQQEAKDLFVQAQKMEAIGRLTGGVAHDFNNMLTAIGGYTQLLALKTDQDGDTRKYLDELQEVVKRSASLTHQLLAISRKGNLEPRPVDLEEGIRSLGKMLRRIIGENIHLELDLPENSWKVNVDPVQIDQVLLNLAVNASDAMPNGGTLSIATEKLTVDHLYAAQHPGLELGDYLLINVSDSGVGIPAEVASHIFEPYFTTKSEGKGTGLGLSTSYGIVKQLGGDLWFRSERGRGTTFKMCLPRAYDEGDAAGTHHRLATSRRADSIGRILVAEDNQEVRSVMIELLQREGHSVTAVSDGEQALRMIEDPQELFDVLIVDMVMPRVSGLEVIEAVYRLRPNVGVIVTSGYTRDERANLEITALADKFLEKPFAGARLLSMVRGLI